MLQFCIVFVIFKGFVESATYVEKIKAFEEYFTSQIDLYDKVHIKCSLYFFNMYKDVIDKHLLCTSG